jgi:hypothetical protein
MTLMRWVPSSVDGRWWRDQPVVGVVGRGDLEEAGRHLGLRVVLVAAQRDGQDDVVVLDDRDDAPDERELDEQARGAPRPGGPWG